MNRKQFLLPLMIVSVFAAFIAMAGPANAQPPYNPMTPCICESVPISVSPSLGCTIELRFTYPGGVVSGIVLLPGAKTTVPCQNGLLIEMRIGGNCWVALTPNCTAVYGVSGSPNCCVNACIHENMQGCLMITISPAHVAFCQMCHPGGDN